MNLGKFQKKFKENFEGAKSIGQLYDAGLEIIEELERALDTKNKEPDWVLYQPGEWVDEKRNEIESIRRDVKRYNDYWVE